MGYYYRSQNENKMLVAQIGALSGKYVISKRSSGSSTNLEGVREKQQTNMAQTMVGSPHANMPSQKASGSTQILKSSRSINSKNLNSSR